MAAATQPTPSLEITTADDMDLQSDDGAIDYNDGDIDLDLEPPPSYAQDDDVSINDAASASGMDAQTAPGGEHDDYMVDQEDVIEEDYSFQGDDNDTAVEQQPVMVDAAADQTEQTIQDEDLLDYSEEDDDYHDTALRSPWLQKHYSMQDDTVQADDTTAQQDEIPADLQALMSMTTSKNSQSPYADPDHVADGSPEADKHEASPRPQSAGHNEEDVQTRGDEGGVQLQGHEDYASTETGPDDSVQASHDHGESVQDNEHQADDSYELPPVTVNYMGEELWLFKHHDYENSGGWLLDDVSVARTSMSDLFQACRLALGTEVLDGMELGFRFDHLQNTELFEESTASVAVSLERLASYYYSLHEQDGNTEPDSFYITLVHRPRFATLLADIARHADKGSGYSGFEAAIAAGETHFHNASVDLQSDELTEWEPEVQDEEEVEVQVDVVEVEQEQVDAEEQQHVHHQQQEPDEQEHEENAVAKEPVEEQVSQEDDGQAYAEAHVQPQEEAAQDDTENPSQEATEHEQNNDEEDDAQADDEEGGVEVHESEETVAVHASGEDHEGEDGEDAPQATNPSEVPTDAQEVVDYPEQPRSQSGDRTEAEIEARRLQEQGDLIDYSDEEDEPSAAVEEAEQAPGTELSPSSTTVRGDDSNNAEKPASVAGSPHLNQQTTQDHDGASFETVKEPSTGNEPDQLEGNDDEHSYQDYVQAFEEDDLSHGFQADEAGDNAANFQYDGDANQEYADYEYQDFEQQPELDFMNGEEFNAGGNTGTDGDDFTGTNDFLDLDDTQWAAGQELSQEAPEDTCTANDTTADTQDQEDGVAAQAENATSSAADPTTASSTDANDVSPQGHKRSIDEAGHGVDIAPDSIGMLLYISPRKRNAGANFFQTPSAHECEGPPSLESWVFKRTNRQLLPPLSFNSMRL